MNQRTKTAKTCIGCGASFYPFRASKGWFCSNKCKFKEKEKTYKITCAGCGGWVESKKDGKKFCTNECYQLSKKSRSAIDRLEPWINRTAYCWLWTGGLNSNGYGRIFFRGKFHLAHRLMFETVTGEDIVDKVVRHFICDNPSCVNPNHLRSGTKQNNSQDMVDHERHAHGETSYAKLTEAQAVAIIADPRKHSEIATEYGIARRTVGHIKTGSTWKHLAR